MRSSFALPASCTQPESRPSTAASGGSGAVRAVPQLNLMGSLRLSQQSSGDQTPIEQVWLEIRAHP